MMVVLTVVGHVAIDRVITDQGERTQIGGPPSYVSLVSRRLGLDVRVVTKVGGDLPSRFVGRLRRLGIDLRGQTVEGAPTTRFVLDYRRAPRRLSVESVCEDILPEDVGERHGAVLISPIVGEVPPQTASMLAGAEFVALDPQGYVRGVGGDGSVVSRAWLDKELLGRVSVYKSSAEELALVTGEVDPWRGLEEILGMGAEVALVTMGPRGAGVSTRGGRYRIPVYGRVSVVDPTGAGDVFMGGFLSEYLRGRDAPWCAAVGAAAASSVVETAGAAIPLSARGIMGRAEEIYDGTVRV